MSHLIARFAMLCALACPLRVAAQTRTSIVILRVVSRADGSAVGSARVTFDDQQRERTADASGQLVVRLPMGSAAVVRLRRIGFEPTAFAFRVAEADTTQVELSLQPVATSLDTIAVRGTATSGSARLADYERRRTLGRGTFVSREQLEKWQPQRPTDALRRVLGLRVMDSSGTRVVVSSRGGKLVESSNRQRGVVPCVLRIGVDGIVREPGFNIDQIAVAEIHAFEIYSGPASMPPEFSGSRRDAFCGLVMVWTRSQ